MEKQEVEKKHKSLRFASLAKRFLLASAILLFLLSITVSGVAAWLATGERSAAFLVPWMKESLDPMVEAQGYQYQVEHIKLFWPLASRSIELRLKELHVASKQGDVTSSFPEVAIGVDMPALLKGELRAEYMSIQGPEFHMMRQPDGQWSIGEGSPKGAATMHQLLAGWALTSYEEQQIRAIYIRNATFHFKDRQAEHHWYAPGTQVSLKKMPTGLVEGELAAQWMLRTPANEKNTPDARALTIQGGIHVTPEEKLLQAHLSFEELNTPLLAQLDPSLRSLKAFHLPLKGHVELDFHMDKRMPLAKFYLEGGQGTIDLPDHYNQPVPVDRFVLQASVTENGDYVLVDEAMLAHETMQLITRGVWSQEKEGPWRFEGSADVHSLPVKNLPRYWPTSVAPNSRKWVVAHILEGTVNEAHADITLTQEDIETLPLPPHVIDATLRLEDATIRYYDDMEPVTQANGQLTFKQNNMQGTIDTGKLGEATLSDGTLDLPEMTSDDAMLTLTAHMQTPLNYLVHFLQHPAFGFAEEIQLTPQGVKGQAEGKLNIAVPVKRGAQPMQYTIDGKIQKAALQQLFGNIDIHQANAEVLVKNGLLKLDGRMHLNEQPATLSLTRTDKASQSPHLRYHVKMDTSAEALSRFGITVPPLLKGPLALETDVTRRDGVETIEAKADITKASLAIDRFGYTKSAGESGTLEFKAQEKQDSPILEVKEFYLNADNLLGIGKMGLNAKTGDIAHMTLEKAVFGRNDFSLALSQTTMADGKSMLKASLQGNQLDMSHMYQADNLFTEGAFKLPHMQVDIEMARVLLGKDRELRNFKGHATCTAEICLSSNVDAAFTTGEMIHYTLGYENSVRSIRVESGNAGELLRLLQVSDNIAGGHLELTGAFNDELPTRPLKGLLIVNHFKTIKAPVLAKLLNIASLTGIQELLSGKGIAFDKMSIPFQLDQGILSMENARAFGGSLGITADGNLNTKTSELNIKGTLVPSYTINNMFSDIPILGKLTGGEGLFAANYSVYGPYTEPKISVNPLSVLAPGFLRNLFQARSPEAENKAIAEQKEAEKVKEAKEKRTEDSKFWPSEEGEAEKEPAEVE